MKTDPSRSGTAQRRIGGGQECPDCGRIQGCPDLYCKDCGAQLRERVTEGRTDG